MVSGLGLEGGSSNISRLVRLNHLGDLSLKTAHVHETPSLPVEGASPTELLKGRSGIRISGDSIGARIPNRIFAPSLASRQ